MLATLGFFLIPVGVAIARYTEVTSSLFDIEMRVEINSHAILFAVSVRVKHAVHFEERLVSLVLSQCGWTLSPASLNKLWTTLPRLALSSLSLPCYCK